MKFSGWFNQVESRRHNPIAEYWAKIGWAAHRMHGETLAGEAVDAEQLAIEDAPRK